MDLSFSVLLVSCGGGHESSFFFILYLTITNVGHFCFEGVLLRKLEAGLRGVSHVIVDEIHERDVNTDFLLVVLRDMLSVYPDLRVILMSATMDVALFTQYFNSCHVIYVEGRTFPVETYYLEDIVSALGFQPSPDSIR